MAIKCCSCRPLVQRHPAAGLPEGCVPTRSCTYYATCQSAVLVLGGEGGEGLTTVSGGAQCSIRYNSNRASQSHVVAFPWPSVVESGSSGPCLVQAYLHTEHAQLLPCNYCLVPSHAAMLTITAPECLSLEWPHLAGNYHAYMGWCRPLSSPQRSKQAVHNAWKATGSSFTPSSEAQSSGRLPGHAPQVAVTSSSGGRAVWSSPASAKSTQRLRQRQQLVAASLLAQQAALQVHLATCLTPCMPPAFSRTVQPSSGWPGFVAQSSPWVAVCERKRQHLQLRQQGHHAYQAMGRQQWL